MIFISYYTGENYKKWADKLKTSLLRFGLVHYIEEIKSTGRWETNTCKKAEFVKDCLLRFRQPVCWLDSDCQIVQYPKLLLNADSNNINLQVYNWLADSDNRITKSNPRLISHTKLLSSGGVFAFNYSPNSLEFVDDWVNSTTSCPKAEDQVMDDIFNNGNYANKLKCRWLPKSYNRMDTQFPEIQPVINHTYTAGKIFNGNV